MKKEFKFEGVTKSTTFDYLLQTPNGAVPISIVKTESDLYWPYVKDTWTEDKEPTLRDAIESCLRYLGLSEKHRRALTDQAVDLYNKKL